ncbi:Chlorite dismutase [Poriferisphaera corsica]|uniref:Chlorite dismutase n=1 Tax=Poriferisphaera corsica TaxID=2528020 RepID=A0A517YPX4_9BACT|nr:chlorite dismutase family protein [Poriferisphaera corsica]QDU32262.1 Chlorite dismutase [Poriferisphaera corsica]
MSEKRNHIQMGHGHGEAHGGSAQHGSGGGGKPGGKPGGMPEGMGGMMGGEKPDLREKGANGQATDRRLFMQLLVFTGCLDTDELVKALEASGIQAVLYEDVNDPQGVGLLTMSEDEGFFVGELRGLLKQRPFDELLLVPEYTMFGRSYSLGYEAELEDGLVDRPRRYVMDEDWKWAVWYPLRRGGAFEQLDEKEQMGILREHGAIGFAYGRGGYAKDVRLACHGMGGEDNDFVIGVLGQRLHPCSAIVQRMRKTQQTSLYLENLGPFFVGRATWQSGVK